MIFLGGGQTRRGPRHTRPDRGASGSVNRIFRLLAQSDPATRTGFMIADAVRYMSVHSWTQWDLGRVPRPRTSGQPAPAPPARQPSRSREPSPQSSAHRLPAAREDPLGAERTRREMHAHLSRHRQAEYAPLAGYPGAQPGGLIAHTAGENQAIRAGDGIPGGNSAGRRIPYCRGKCFTMPFHFVLPIAYDATSNAV